ncbi:MAG: DUF4870 domain-containing protein [Opitutae bacterium]
MNIVEELEKLESLRRSGTISQAEFDELKQALFEKNRSLGSKVKDSIGSDNNWCMLIHFSQFCTYLIPLAGIIVPILLWQFRKDESEEVDIHGRIVTNWIISTILYLFVFGILCLFFIGIPFVVAVSLAAIIFPIIGGIKASNGEIWKYPCSINFFRVHEAYSHRMNRY